jgi:hypothetical protein
MTGGKPSLPEALSAPISSNVRINGSAVMDCLDQSRSGGVWHAGARHYLKMVRVPRTDCSGTLTEGVVDPLQSLRLSATFFFDRYVVGRSPVRGRHSSQRRLSLVRAG